MVKSLIKLLEFRNSVPAFDLDGSIKVETPSEHEIVITRMKKKYQGKIQKIFDFFTFAQKYHDYNLCIFLRLLKTKYLIIIFNLISQILEINLSTSHVSLSFIHSSNDNFMLTITN